MLMLTYWIVSFSGLIIGSFLNVLIDRLPTGKNPWKGRSKCDYCKKTLAWYDLIPLFSFISLRGRCRYCHKQLSIQYPLIEIITGFLFVIIFTHTVGQFSIFNFQFSNFLDSRPYTLVPLLIIFSSFLVIFMADFKYWIIPDEMVVSAGIGALLLRVITSTLNINFIFSSIGAGLFFLLIFLLTRGRGMGFGDVKLTLVLGLFLGFPNIIVGIYIAFLTGATVSLILILVGKKRLKQRIAFGPFLILGTIVSFFWGNEIVKFYLTFF